MRVMALIRVTCIVDHAPPKLRTWLTFVVTKAAPIRRGSAVQHRWAVLGNASRLIRFTLAGGMVKRIVSGSTYTMWSAFVQTALYDC